MNNILNYSEDWELTEYIKMCKRVSPIERLKYVERRIRQSYELMPDAAKRNFFRLRDEEVRDITEKFK